MNAAYAQAIQDYEEGESDFKPAPLRGDRAVVVNVTSKTYGTDIVGNKVQNMIFANTSLPVKRTLTFNTTYDNQRFVSMKVFESDFTNEETDFVVEDRFCNRVGNDEVLKLTKDWPKGTPITVTFNIDNEGILSVNAFVEKDILDFSLTIEGVKNAEELNQSKAIITKAVVE